MRVKRAWEKCTQTMSHMRQSETNNNNDDDDGDDDDDEKLTYKNIWNGQVVKHSSKYNGVVTTTNKTVTEFTLECSLKWQLCTMCPIRIPILTPIPSVSMCLYASASASAMHRIVMSKFISFLFLVVVVFFCTIASVCVSC